MNCTIVWIYIHSGVGFDEKKNIDALVLVSMNCFISKRICFTCDILLDLTNFRCLFIFLSLKFSSRENSIAWFHHRLFFFTNDIFFFNDWIKDLYLQINTWAFPYWPGYHPETPILALDWVRLGAIWGSRDDNQANMDMPIY